MSYRLEIISDQDHDDWKRYHKLCFDSEGYIDPSIDMVHFKYVNKKTKQTVGYCTVKLNHSLDYLSEYGLSSYDPTMKVNSLWNVCSTKKEKGICTKMIRSVLTKYCFVPMTLAVYKTNEPALKCYKTVGFSYMNNKNKNSDAYFMIY